MDSLTVSSFPSSVVTEGMHATNSGKAQKEDPQMGLCGFGLFIRRSQYPSIKLHCQWSQSVDPRTTKKGKQITDIFAWIQAYAKYWQSYYQLTQPP